MQNDAKIYDQSVTTHDANEKQKKTKERLNYYEKKMKAQNPDYVKRHKAPNTSRDILKHRLIQLAQIKTLQLSIAGAEQR